MEKRGNYNNLIPFNERTKEEHRAISKRGGQRSGEARRKKREQIELLKLQDKANLELICETAKLLKMISKDF